MSLIKIDVRSGAEVWINPDAVVQLIQSTDLKDYGYFEIVLTDDSHYVVKGTPQEFVERIKRDEHSGSLPNTESGPLPPKTLSGKFRKGK